MPRQHTRGAPPAAGMAELRVASLERSGERGFTLLCRDGAGAPLARCTVLAVDDACVRVSLRRCEDAHADAPLPPPRTPAVLPGLGRVTASVATCDDGVELRTAALTLRATLSPSLSLRWARAEAHGGAVFAQDRASRAYALGRGTPHAAHAARRGEDDAFYGLGDKTGPLDLAGRRLRTLMTDALGRDAACVCAANVGGIIWAALTRLAATQAGRPGLQALALLGGAHARRARLQRLLARGG